MKKKRSVILKAFFAIILFIIVVFLWAMGGIQRPGVFEGQIVDFGLDNEVEFNNSLVVMTWNIAYAYGKGSGGSEFHLQSKEEMENSIRTVGEIIKESEVDIVLMQEIDFDSHRSGNMDQLKILANITGLKYGAYAINWKAGYIPFPYWPPKSHFGKMNSGTAVLSKYPITINKVTLHPKPETNSWIYNQFYLFRSSQYVKIKFGEKTFGIINNHLEAYNAENREKQASALVEMADEFENSTAVLAFIGGDMNTVPIKAAKKHDFLGHPDDNYVGDKTFEILTSMNAFNGAISEGDYIKNESSYFTFPSDKPDRKLDYIFVNDKITVTNAYILHAGDISDHLPIVAELKLT